MNELAGPLIFSLQVALYAVCLVTALAVPVAFAMTRSRSRYRRWLEICLTIPLVLPPTVIGYFLLVVLGRHGWLGRYLDSWFGYSIMFHWHGAVLAAAVICFPLVYLPTRAAFAAVDRELEDIARLQGAGTLSLFWYVSLPMATKGIAAGMVLAFARALGEFGATMMVMGDTQRYRTLPLLIYGDYSGSGVTATASCAVLVLTAMSVLTMAFYSRFACTQRR